MTCHPVFPLRFIAPVNVSDLVKIKELVTELVTVRLDARTCLRTPHLILSIDSPFTFLRKQELVGHNNIIICLSF